MSWIYVFIEDRSIIDSKWIRIDRLWIWINMYHCPFPICHVDLASRFLNNFQCFATNIVFFNASVWVNIYIFKMDLSWCTIKLISFLCFEIFIALVLHVITKALNGARGFTPPDICANHDRVSKYSFLYWNDNLWRSWLKHRQRWQLCSWIWFW